MAVISDIRAREVLDSRGNPTLEVECEVEVEAFGRVQIPSGASTGANEAHEKRDGDKGRFLGKGVLRCVEIVEGEIREKLVGQNALDQCGIDKTLIELDGTPNKDRLGANTILGVSLSSCKACANFLNLPLYRYIGGMAAQELPVPLMNVLNGGRHADNSLDVQEFMIVPCGFDGFSQALRAGVEVFHSLKELLKARGHTVSVGDEGGFAPDLRSTDEALSVLVEAIELARYKPGEEIFLALDVAASELFCENDDRYEFKGEGKTFTTEELVEFYEGLVSRYPILSIEDGLYEEDWAGWRLLTDRLGDRIQVVGDDLFCTNPRRLKQGIMEGCANAILVKLNQIGTLTETLETINLARKHGFSVIISHRSGETEDTFISDLSVAINSGQIKTGSCSRTDRVCKYNQLLRIEESLGKGGVFRGRDVFSR